MNNNLDVLTVPDNPHSDGREIFDPVNAWPDASTQVFVSTHRSGSGVFQVGYDPGLAITFVRSLGPGGNWGNWMALVAPPPPEPEPDPEATTTATRTTTTRKK
jgi:hypothetical protein